MKSILTLAFCLLLNGAFCVMWHPKVEKLSDYELTGNVREVNIDAECTPPDTTSLALNFGLYVKSRNGCRLNAKFNEAGYLTYRKNWYEQWHDTYEVYIEYLNDSLPIKFTEIEYGDSSFYLIDYDSRFRMTKISHTGTHRRYSWSEFIYDDRKNITYIKNHHKSIPNSTDVEIYNEHGDILASHHRKSKYAGTVRSTFYEYNSVGLLVSKEFRDKSNKGNSEIGLYEYRWERYEYDQTGNQITVLECVNSEKKPIRITRNTYNENSQITTHKDSNFFYGWWCLDSMSYTSTGQIESVISYNDGLPWRVIHYSYNTAGNMLSKITQYHSYQSLSDTKSQLWKSSESSHYEYDDKGNWIKVVDQDQEGLTKSTSRTITYY